jgi:hypothetical protein
VSGLLYDAIRAKIRLNAIRLRLRLGMCPTGGKISPFPKQYPFKSMNGY